MRLRFIFTPMKVAAALLMTPGVAAVGQEVSRQSSPEPERITIEIGMLSSGGESAQRLRGIGSGAEALGGGDWMQEELRSFMASHPEIEVKTLGLESPRRLDEPLASSPILPENIIGLDSWFSDEVVYLADRELIVPIENFADSDPEFDFDLFYENLWDSVTYQGKRWGVPWVSDPLVLVCNWPMFERAGIERPPESWDEFLDFARRMTLDTDGDGETDQWGYGASLRGINAILLYTMIFQKGYPLFTETGLDVNHPSVRETLQFLHALYHDPSFKGDYRGLEISNCAMEIVVASYLHRFPDSSSFVLAPLPTFGRKVTSSYGRLYLAIRKSTPAKERAAWELIKWITRKDVAIPKAWGGYPVRKDFIERQDFIQRSQSGMKNLEVLYEMNAWTIDPGPHFKNRNVVLRQIWTLFGPAIRRDTPIDEILPQVQAFADSNLEPLATKVRSYDVFR